MIIDEGITHYIFSFLNAIVQISIIVYIYRNYLYPRMIELYQKHHANITDLINRKEQTEQLYARLNNIVNKEKNTYAIMQNRVLSWKKYIDQETKLKKIALETQTNISITRRIQQINTIELRQLTKKITPITRATVQKNLEIYFNNQEAANRYIHNIINGLPKE